MRYSVGGRCVATAATADNVGAELWNPHGSKAIFVRTVSWTKTVATIDNPALCRSSAKGTSTLTVTPDADNAMFRDAVPASGATLELTFSAQPTLAKPYLMQTNLPAAIGANFIWVFDPPGLLVPFGTGLVVATPVAVVQQPADVTFEWDE